MEKNTERYSKKYFAKKLIIFNVILTFSDHQKSKIFFVGDHGGRHNTPFNRISGSGPVLLYCKIIYISEEKSSNALKLKMY